MVGSIVEAPILNIDHHISNLRFADYYYLNSNAAATGEIIFELFRLTNFPINADIATCLYTAIATDCGFFRYANTTSATMRYAAELIENGAKPHVISESLESRPLDAVLALTKVLETLETYYKGKIAAITVYPDMVSEPGSTEGFINYPRNIEGVEIAIMFKVVDEKTVRVSLRSRRADVSKLALSFGGGGHARAAGCTIFGSLAEAKNTIMNAAIKQIGEIA
jgi:phosphoesterase RecJ-like protein